MPGQIQMNQEAGRIRVRWESRYVSVIVKEEAKRALRMIGAFIDQNPVRTGMVSEPADYRWSGDAEAMSGKARARHGLVREIGQMAWPRETFSKSTETRACGVYRAILGGQGGRNEGAGMGQWRGVDDRKRRGRG